LSFALLGLLFATSLAAATPSACKSVIVESMPEEIEPLVSAGLARLGIAVVGERDRADCVVVFASSMDVSAAPAVPVVAGSTEERFEMMIQQAAAAGGSPDRPVRVAALGLVHRASSEMVWSASATFDASRPPAPKVLVSGLLGRLDKDLRRVRKGRR
jgi:AcrR family transcriptional regulator